MFYSLFVVHLGLLYWVMNAEIEKHSVPGLPNFLNIGATSGNTEEPKWISWHRSLSTDFPRCGFVLLIHFYKQIFIEPL
jgi:hypothetical protein